MSKTLAVDWQSYSPKQLTELSQSLSPEEQAEIEVLYLDWLCSQDPLIWLQHVTYTENPKAKKQGLEYRAHFPQKAYFIELFKAFYGVVPYVAPNPDKPRLFIPKTREMMTSWAVIGYAAWRAQWHQWDVIVQTEAEKKAFELVDYADQLYRNQGDSLKSQHPLRSQSMEEIRWANGGRLMAIPKGADKLRLYHPSLYVMDEASFLPEAGECYDTASPVAGQIIAVSSAGPGWFAEQCIGDARETVPGVRTWSNQNQVRIFRLHYEADEVKSQGQKIWNERQKVFLSPWADGEERSMSTPERYRQEYEVDFEATAGQKYFQFIEKATMCAPFPIPKDWTKFMALDPHPRVPPAILWCAISPDGIHYYYREWWESEICGKNGKPPVHDNQPKIWKTVEVIKYLESGCNEMITLPARVSGGEQVEQRTEPGNWRNLEPERIYKRVIDYAARGMGKGTIDDPEQMNFQQRYELHGDEIGIDMRFEDAKKDRGVGIDMVNDGLLPLPYLDPSYPEPVLRSRIQIFEGACPELVWELKNTRYKQLTPIQAETKELPADPIRQRDHMVDCMRYIEMASPQYIPPSSAVDTWSPINDGVNF